MSKPIIITERLILRPMNVSDSDNLFTLWSNPVVNKYLWDPLYKNVDEVKKLFSAPDDPSNYAFVVILKDTNEFIGSCGIGPENKGAYWGFGYSFLPEFWGKGYATEVLKAMIEFGHGLGISDFCGSFAIDNAASGKVMEKCGLHFDHFGEFTKADKSATFKSKYYKLHLPVEGERD